MHATKTLLRESLIRADSRHVEVFVVKGGKFRICFRYECFVQGMTDFALLLVSTIAESKIIVFLSGGW